MPSLISGLILLSRVALWVVVATSVPSALSSHPPSTIANCSSSVTPIKPYGYRPFFHSYGPQLEGNKGWETWTLTLNHIAYDSMSVFEWSRGDPASPSSNLHGPGTFSMMTAYNGVSTSIADEFLYEEDEDAGLFHISIGENHLIFDGTVGDIGSWNYSVKFGGLESAGFMLLYACLFLYKLDYTDETVYQRQPWYGFRAVIQGRTVATVGRVLYEPHWTPNAC